MKCDYDGESDDRKQNQDGDHPLRGLVGEQSKCSASIFDVGDAKEPGNYRDTFVQSQLARYGHFGDAIKADNTHSDDELKLAHNADGRYSSSFRIALQRSHTDG